MRGGKAKEQGNGDAAKKRDREVEMQKNNRGRGARRQANGGTQKKQNSREVEKGESEGQASLEVEG
jgi:hypothetical protein